MKLLLRKKILNYMHAGTGKLLLRMYIKYVSTTPKFYIIVDYHLSYS